MSVAVRLPRALRAVYDVPDPAAAPPGTVAGVIQALDRAYPGVAHRLVDAGELRRHIIVFVADERGDLTTPVPDGTELTVVTAVAGG